GRGGGGACARDLEVVTVPGDHHRMVRPPHVEALAEVLRGVVDRARLGLKPQARRVQPPPEAG
ncbi:MAG TPA: hypothetical protein VNM67_05235, partial [Thermoanaerobaculia bacterium]|nr:hypothetical protein [Thermoanaerobaculia bacterium]